VNFLFKISLVVCLLAAVSLPRVAQGQNLVLNFSFEQFDTCPDAASQIHRVTNWINANTGTTDYYNSCFTTGSSNMDTPNNLFGFQNAKTGVAYAGLYTYLYSPSPFHYREYLQVKLNTPLNNGVKYFISFNVSLADSSYYMNDDIGAYLSTTQISQGDYLNISNTPHIENTDGNYLSDTNNWVRIHGEYIASGGEEYIVIGNFYDDFNTDTIRVKNGSNNTYLGAYYYVDDIYVSTDSMTYVNPINTNYKVTLKDGNMYVNSNNNSSFNIFLFNIFGEIVHQSFNHSNSFRYNISKLNSSVYFLNIYNNTENHTQKIFINN